MKGWLLRLLNLPTDHLQDATVAFQSPVLLIVGLVLLVPAAVFIYLRQRWNLPTVPTGLRLTLTLTRVLILALLVWVIGSPVLKVVYTEEQKPVVAVVFDHSQSMLQLPAGPFESPDEMTKIAAAAGYRASGSTLDGPTRRALNQMSRAKLAHAVFETSAQPFLKELSKKYDVQYYSFARDLKRLGVDPAKGKLPEPPPPGTPGSHATHLGDAIGRILEEAARRPGANLPDLDPGKNKANRVRMSGGGGPMIGGIVVLTDGQNTGGRSPGDAALAASKAGTPLFTVPVGSSKRPKDIAIVDLFATSLVTVGDTARVNVTIESNGFDGQPVDVELKDGDKLRQKKKLVLRSNEQQQVELTFKATKPGAHYLTVHVPPQEGEPKYLHANNTDTAFVRVSDERLKVLYIEGLPRWDFRFIKNSMLRDNGLGGLGLGGRPPTEIDVVLEAEWRRGPKEKRALALPRTLDKLAEYNTIILGDVSPRLLDGAFIELLGKAVRERGVGLIVEAGPLSMPHKYDERLLDLLPVRVRPGVPGRYPRGIPSFRIDLAPEGSIHEAMRFYDDPGRNAIAWANLPRFYWSAAAERPSPGATVLAWNPIETAYGKVPLIAHHYAGRGRVMFVGTDSTWLWRQNVGDRFFYRFWGQATRFAARRDAKSGKKSWIEVRPVRAQPGEQAEVEVMAFGANGAPLTATTQNVQVKGGGPPEKVELSADPTVKGRYVGKFTPALAGEYRLTYAAEGQKEPVEARLRVSPSSEELRQPMVNRQELEQLAITANGQMVELPDLASLEKQFKGEPTFYSYPYEQTLWDGWRTLAILIVLYTLDVGLRRLMGLS